MQWSIPYKGTFASKQKCLLINVLHWMYVLQERWFIFLSLIGQYCGTTIDSVIRSHSNRMYLKFVTDATESGRGFSISYDATQSGV